MGPHADAVPVMQINTAGLPFIQTSPNYFKKRDRDGGEQEIGCEQVSGTERNSRD